MTYEQLNQWFPKGARKWCKWCNYIYLRKYRGAIHILHGYRYRAARLMAVWYPDGRFKFKVQCYYPSMRGKLDYLLPQGYKIISYRYYSFLDTPKNEEPMAFYIRSEDRRQIPDFYGTKKSDWVVISKDGVKPKLGPALSEIKAKLIGEDMVRAKPRRRGQFWVRKARGIFRKSCGKTYFQGCRWSRTWPRPTTNWKGECGCEVYTRRAVSHDTIADIMKEPNATVRTAKIQIYGIDKFFTDAQAKTINEEGRYQLLEINTGKAERDPRWGIEPNITPALILRALRMTCPSTSQTYVNTVPPDINTVRRALDWVYNIENYMERVGVQT